MIDAFDEIMIRNYFSFPEIYQSLQRYKKMLRVEFYSRNMATHTAYTSLGIITKGFRPDREVEKLYECLELVDKRLTRYLFRDKQFNKYLSGLSSEERDLLYQGFKGDKQAPIIPSTLLEKTINEIYEIEAAICFREGIEPEEPERLELTDDVDENLERLCDFFAL